MAQNYQQSGDQIEVTLGSVTTVASGKMLVVGDQVGVVLSLTRNGETVFANQPSASGDVAVVALKGVFVLPKVAPLVIAQGEKVYTNGTAITNDDDDGGNAFVGYAHATGASADTAIAVRLHQL
jgi:predicted RecA/RadA family phage recombinase